METKIANVIVDLPLFQTDQTFSYAIPDSMLDILSIGMRVHVPFGRNNRLIQGVVTEIFIGNEDELKEIKEVLDVEPVLNQEQLWLANEMRHTVFSYKITILKAMLPNLLNSSYDKEIIPKNTMSTEHKSLIFEGQSKLLFSQLSQEKLNLVMTLLAKKQIEINYIAKDKQNIKLKKFFKVDRNVLDRLVIKKQAKKRLELRDYLLTCSKSKELSDLYKLYSRAVVDFFIKEKAILITERSVNRSDIYFEHINPSKSLELNKQQKYVVDTVLSKMGQDSKPFLLEGITGSGKTEVYLHIIKETLRRGQTAIVLVPEISLTPQMTNRFISRFGKQVAIMHSGLSDGEKFDEWRKIRRGEAKVVVGARSAIFAPLENIGAIIIDEEHEASYKQESNPRYHARDVAILRAKYNHAIVLLGSATPSIESRARASKGVYHFLELTERANPLAKVPEVSIVDFRDYIGQQSLSNYTPKLLEEIKKCLEKGEQAVLLLNRRGYSSFMMCRDCGHVDTCPNCDISLTLHMDTRSMNCHYCDFKKAILRVCPNCYGTNVKYYGTGTQKAYEELLEVFPNTKILRMDVDTTRKKGAHEKLLTQFGNHEADILIGTQMIAKGLDFPNVTLVGVLNADTSLYLPDFRASERTFQLLTQVAGRAGRAEKEGKVFIQTYNPKHYAIQFARNQDYEGFYKYEMSIRRNLSYPPYYFTVGISLSHRNEDFLVEKSYEILKLLKQQLSHQIQILGPTPKPIARTHNLYHYQIIVKYRFENQLEETLNQILELSQMSENKDLRLIIDFEPQSFA